MNKVVRYSAALALSLGLLPITAVPAPWVAALPGQVIAATHVAFLPEADSPRGLEEIAARLFHGHTLVGALVAVYISIEAPLSGMSMNPARTFGSAFGAHLWTSLWIYFTAPPLGMLLAAESYKRIKGSRPVACAKLHHYNNKRCIFQCNFQP